MKNNKNSKKKFSKVETDQKIIFVKGPKKNNGTKNYFYVENLDDKNEDPLEGYFSKIEDFVKLLVADSYSSVVMNGSVEYKGFEEEEIKMIENLVKKAESSEFLSLE